MINIYLYHYNSTVPCLQDYSIILFNIYANSINLFAYFAFLLPSSLEVKEL